MSASAGQPGPVAIVTGAGAGIGKATAVRCAEAGYRVFLVDRDEERLRQALEGDLRGFPAAGCRGDVSRAEDVEAGLAECLTQFGRVDALVANAGILRKVAFLEMTAEQWEEVLAINLRGVFLWGQAVARWMVAAGVRGSIVNVSCIRAELMPLGMAAYAASKGGVQALTKAMAVELAPHGIRVNAVAPGKTMTAATAGIYSDPTARQAAEAGIPLGRLGEAEDVAKVIVFLASEEAGYMTGAVVPVDGGFLVAKA